MFCRGEIETDRADLGWNKATCQSEEEKRCGEVWRGEEGEDEGVGRRRTIVGGGVEGSVYRAFRLIHVRIQLTTSD